jgi:nicotinamide mononucleotide transporter
MQEIYQYLVSNWLENLGILSTLICVYLNTRQNIWGWPWAILASIIYGLVYYQAKLYSDMELQIVFIVISGYGWSKWLYGGQQKNDLPVTYTPKKYYLVLLIIILLFALASGYLHGKYTDAALPYFDSTLTAISLVAQWQMARKYIENWILWITANLGYIVMYFSKNLMGTSVLYVLLLGLAIYGYWGWRKTLITEN